MTMGAIISQLIHAEDRLHPFISDFCRSFDNHILHHTFFMSYTDGVI